MNNSRTFVALHTHTRTHTHTQIHAHEHTHTQHIHNTYILTHNTHTTHTHAYTTHIHTQHTHTTHSLFDTCIHWHMICEVSISTHCHDFDCFLLKCYSNKCTVECNQGIACLVPNDVHTYTHQGIQWKIRHFQTLLFKVMRSQHLRNYDYQHILR